MSKKLGRSGEGMSEKGEGMSEKGEGLGRKGIASVNPKHFTKLCLLTNGEQ